ncbi:MAG: methyltransferase domain-containing protein [Gemmatimonadetes bacterium]|nr:methyltransferase domain-containing protein [Gemmatimonadota bacterium]
MKILDVGCGNDKLPGAVGLDRGGAEADIRHDLDHLPWPVEADAFDLIRCQDVLEHLDDLVAVMEEIHRVARPGAEVRIRVPHFSSVQAFTDITHRHFFSTESFQVFVPDQTLYPHYSRVRFGVEQARLTLWKPYRWVGIEWLANRFPVRYEKMFAFLFPSQYLEFRLRVLPPELEP